jgi:hypothetical protein
MIRKIDLSSIKENPSAGRTTYLIPGKSWTEVSEDGKTTTTRRDVQQMRSLTPEPKWLYEYEPIELECQHCHAKIKPEDITDDWWDTMDGDEVYIPNICPVCKKADCLAEKLQYETIEEALKRKATCQRTSSAQ